MSAKYYCNICRKEMREHQPEFQDYKFPYGGRDSSVRVVIKVDCNQYGNKADICNRCGRKAIIDAVKQLKDWWKKQDLLNDK